MLFVKVFFFFLCVWFLFYVFGLLWSLFFRVWLDFERSHCIYLSFLFYAHFFSVKIQLLLLFFMWRSRICGGASFFLVCRYLEISFPFVFHSKKYGRFHFLCFALRMWDDIWICVWINSFFSFYYCLHNVFGLRKIGCKWYFISRLCNFESWINDIWFCILPLVLCLLTLSGCEISCFAFVFDLMIFLLANRWIAENSCYSLFHFSFPQNYVSFRFVWLNSVISNVWWMHYATWVFSLWFCCLFLSIYVFSLNSGQLTRCSWFLCNT